MRITVVSILILTAWLVMAAREERAQWMRSPTPIELFLPWMALALFVILVARAMMSPGNAKHSPSAGFIALALALCMLFLALVPGYQ